MSNAKFTPGPWAIMEYKVPRSLPKPDGTRYAIHSTVRVDYVPMPVVVELEGTRMQANAHLIAAAPDLYAALERAETLLDQLCTVAMTPAVADHLPAGTKDLAVAWLREQAGFHAMRKARGEA